MFYIAQIFYKLTINLTKTSILLLYRRIFIQQWFCYSCNTMICIVLAYCIATTVASIFQCTPVPLAWDKSIHHGTCISMIKNWYANAGFAIATDVLILGLPMQPIWTSRLPINQKRALMLVFALGGLCVHPLLLAEQWKNLTIQLLQCHRHLDSTGNYTQLFHYVPRCDLSVTNTLFLIYNKILTEVLDDVASTLWTMIEINVAIICACLPMCRMVLAWLLPGLFGSAMTASSSAAKNPSASDSSDPTVTIGHRRLRSLNGDWTPYAGPSNPEGGNQSSANRVHHHEESSEEFILAPYQKVYLQRGPDGKLIRKTTKYEVFYESEDSAAERGQFNAITQGHTR